jgi:hypothetical protein
MTPVEFSLGNQLWHSFYKSLLPLLLITPYPLFLHIAFTYKVLSSKIKIIFLSTPAKFSR